MNITTRPIAARVFVILCLALTASRASAQACGTNQDLGRIGNSLPQVAAMSADGAIVIGRYDINGVPRAFRWTEATGMQDISMPWGETWATAVSSDGSTIVGYGKNYANLDRAFRWTEATGRQDLGSLGGSSANALAVSADGGVIVGYAANFDGQPRAFRWTLATGMQDVGTLGGYWAEATAVSADGTVVIGTSDDNGFRRRAFRWTAAEGMQDLAPQDPSSFYPRGISADGRTIVGSFALNDSRAFRWASDTGLQDISPPESVQAHATGVSADGNTVVGWRTRWVSNAEVYETFRWTSDGSFEVIPALDGYNTIAQFSERVSADGTVVIGNSTGYSPRGAIRWTERGGSLPLFPSYISRAWATVVSADGDIVAGFADEQNIPIKAWRWIKNPADVNGDGFLNGDDFDQFAEAFETGDPSGDFNHDGFVNGDDYDGFANDFEAGC